ncbi:MAG: hypothetical protein ACTSWW_09260, partial [Promethearchaeota archaeon]
MEAAYAKFGKDDKKLKAEFDCHRFYDFINIENNTSPGGRKTSQDKIIMIDSEFAPVFILKY